MLWSSFSRTVLTFGISLGLVRIGIATAAMYLEGPAALFDSFLLAAALVAVVIVGMIWGGYELRKGNGEIITFGRALLGMFVIFAISGLVSASYNALTFYVLRPEWLEIVPAGHQTRLTFSGMTYEYVSSLIFGSVLATAFAFFLKREEVRVARK